MYRIKKVVRYFSISTPRTIVLLVCVLAIGLFSMYFISSNQGFQQISESPTVSAEEQVFLTLLNQERTKVGAGPLTLDTSLVKSSQWMAQDMATRRSPGHIDSLGRGIGTRIPAFGYPSPPNSASENVGYSTISSIQNIYDGFYNECDPGASGACTYAHRTNMLDPQWKAIGVGMAVGGGAYYWATDFGSKVVTPLDTTIVIPTPSPSLGTSPSPTLGTSPSPTPETSTNPVTTPAPASNTSGAPEIDPTLISCTGSELATASATFDMKKPIYAKTNVPIESVTYKSGNWCAWATGNNDPLANDRCPLLCPKAPNAGYPFTISADKMSFYSDFDSPYPDNSGSCTYEVKCTGSGNPSITPGNENMLKNAAVAIDVTLPGVSPNAAIGDNSSPVHRTRNFDVSLYNANDELVKTVSTPLTFNGTSYTGIATFSDIPTGSYIVKVRSDNSLLKSVSGPKNLVSDQTVDTSEIALVTGNIDDIAGSENILDLSDYNALLSCFDNKACDPKLKLLTDLNDDGKLDSKDFNILLRGFATRTGE